MNSRAQTRTRKAWKMISDVHLKEKSAAHDPMQPSTSCDMKNLYRIQLLVHICLDWQRRLGNVHPSSAQYDDVSDRWRYKIIVSPLIVIKGSNSDLAISMNSVVCSFQSFHYIIWIYKWRGIVIRQYKWNGDIVSGIVDPHYFVEFRLWWLDGRCRFKKKNDGLIE